MLLITTDKRINADETLLGAEKAYRGAEKEATLKYIVSQIDRADNDDDGGRRISVAVVAVVVVVGQR